MTRRRVCAVTGSRADYGLLYWVLRALQDEPSFELQLAVTGMHLSAAFGETVHQIEQDGFRIDARVPMLEDDDSPAGVARSLGRGQAGFGDALARLRPNLLLILGDRFEILAAAQAALFANLPIAHIAGGDTTEGAMDEAIRHALTKMAHLHFVTNAPAQARVIQMGEDPARVFLAGSPGIDAIRRMKLLPREALERELEFRFRARNLLVTFHPPTLSLADLDRQVDALTGALEPLAAKFGILITGSNADPGGRAVLAKLQAFAARHKQNVAVHLSLGPQRYLSAIAQVDAVVGNSSSGLYEAPSLGKPTLNIGDRQQGRPQAASVVNCTPDQAAIAKGIAAALALDCKGVVNPYGTSDAAPKIVAALRGVPDFGALLHKRFRNLPS